MAAKQLTAPFLLLAGLLATACLIPPELHPTGMALEAAIAGGLGWILLRTMRSFPSWSDLRLPMLGLAALLPSLVFSEQRHLSEAALYPLFTAAVVLAAARRQVRVPRGRERIACIMILLASVVALWGVFQASYSLARTARYLRGLGEVALDPLVLRAESGRAFGPFLLPADLGILLVMVLPLTLHWLLTEPRRARRLLAAAALLAQILGLAATRSYGAAFSLFSAALLLLPFTRLKGKLRLWTGLLACGLVTGGGIFLARGAEGVSPLSLRIGNWQAAWQVFRSHPCFGVGFGNFGDAVTRHLLAGMNETAFAHNSYLQILAESGIAGLAAVLLGLGVFATKLREGLMKDPDVWRRLAACLPPVTFLLHNLFDFSAYLPSLLTVAAGLSALSLRAPLDRIPMPATARPMGLARGIVFGILLAGTTLWGVREAWTAGVIRQAREAVEDQRPELARQALVKVTRINPGHPDPPAMLSEILLEAPPSGTAAQAAGERWARRAVSLRPGRAYSHYVLSRYRLGAGDPGEAWVELARARQLFPVRDLYRVQEAHLREIIASFARPPESRDAP